MIRANIHHLGLSYIQQQMKKSNKMELINILINLGKYMTKQFKKIKN